MSISPCCSALTHHLSPVRVSMYANITRKAGKGWAKLTDGHALESLKKNVVHWAGVARVDIGCEARVVFLRKTSCIAIHENCQK